MLFFISLENIGVGRNQLQDLSDEDIIRIEKQLNASRKLGDVISKDDIEKVVYILRHYRLELGWISFYEGLYSVLRGIPATYEDSLTLHHKSELLRIKELLSVHFSTVLLDFIDRNFRENNWENLLVLVKYKHFLNLEIQEILIAKMEDKLEEVFMILAQILPRHVLTQKVGYLHKKHFYTLMNDIHSTHFSPYIDRFLDFIVNNGNYTTHVPFFDDLLFQLPRYNNGDGRLRLRIFSTVHSHGGQDRFIYFGVLFIVVFLSLFVYWISNRTDLPVPRRNQWETIKGDALGNSEYLRTQQHLDLMSFVEARINPVFNPERTDSLPVVVPRKYGNPFLSGIFNGNFSAIKREEPQLLIFNNTENECIALAYYDDYYHPGKMEYVRKNPTDLTKIYALYIPKNDSIKVDFQLSVLRLYMGNKLKEFNNYRAYVYLDSMDRKFSEFGGIDSTLFRYGFRFLRGKGRKDKEQRLMISKPNDAHYQLDWVGNSKVTYATNYFYFNDRMDTLRKGQSLILPEKHVRRIPKSNKNSKGEEIDADIYSFLPGFN